MHKRIFIFVTLLSIIMLFAGCGESHEHVFTEWTCNATEHWYVCECGKKVEKADHTFDDFNMCSVCGISVNDMGDGTYELITYDEHGSMATLTGYDAKENVLYEQRVDTVYYEDGNPKTVKDYLDGVLISESDYLPCEDPENGEVYMNESVQYDTDTRSVSIYDEKSNMLSYTVYDSDDNVVTADIYTYEYDDNGNLAKAVVTTDGVISRESFYSLDADGNSYISREISYTESGEVDQDISYDEN